jgi:hypothetical protein
VPTLIHSVLRWSSRAAIVVALCVLLVQPPAATSMPTREHAPVAQADEPNPSPRGDTPYEFPGMSGEREDPAAPIQITRPVRTVVRESSPAWVVIVSVVALLGAGFALIRIRSLHGRLAAR